MAKNGEKFYTRHVIPKYGHIDCIFGKDAAKDVYPHMVAQFEKTPLKGAGTSKLLTATLFFSGAPSTHALLAEAPNLVDSAAVFLADISDSPDVTSASGLEAALPSTSYVGRIGLFAPERAPGATATVPTTMVVARTMRS